MTDAEVETTAEDAPIETDQPVDAPVVDDPAPVADSQEKPAEVDYKAKWEAQRAVNRDLEAKLRDERKRNADLQRQIDEQGKTAEEIAEERKQREAADASLRRANERIVKQAIRLAAKGRLNDPDDALAFIDSTEFDVSDTGDVDDLAIEDAITDLLARKPHLAVAAPAAPKFQPVDQGAAGKDARASQLSREDLKKMTPDQILAANKEGRLKSLTGR